MANPVPYAEIRRTVGIWIEVINEGWPIEGRTSNAGNALTETIRRLGFAHSHRTNVQRRLTTGVALGLDVPHVGGVDPVWAEDQRRRYRTYDPEFAEAEARFAGRAQPKPGRAAPRRSVPELPVSTYAQMGMVPPEHASVTPTVEPDMEPVLTGPIKATSPLMDPAKLADAIVPALRRGPLTVEELAKKISLDPLSARLVLEIARTKGVNVYERAGRWHLDNAPPIGSQVEHAHELVTDDDGCLTFAACSDQHLGSKYARLDALNDYYDEVERRGIGTVLNCGNWIDGDAPFNRHDLLVHGMDGQMRYLADHYPRRDGVRTLAITGADHEGWYARREGVDVGRYAADTMRAAGRDDWVDLGYMEAFVPVRHKLTGKTSQICVMHPGGGSAYALSYAPQKIVEGFEGGSKPAVLLIGHYHKSGYNMIRNVHTAQVGCFQDQTLFMRSKKLSAHIGGAFFTIKLDPDTGAVIECSYTFRNYFDVSYYNGRWSQHGPVVQVPKRVVS